MDGGTQDRLDEELAGSSFADDRLGKRLPKLVQLMGNALGSTVLLTCPDWANTKAGSTGTRSAGRSRRFTGSAATSPDATIHHRAISRCGAVSRG